MVDAAFVQDDIEEAYVFSGRRYARIKWTPYTAEEKITWGPAKISENWPAITKAGFGTVEAVLPIPDVRTDFYFFFGGRVARVKFSPGHDDAITEGPLKITEKWKSLSSAGFDTIDSAMVVPGQKDEAYLFKGTKYVRINVKDDKITFGPANLADEWPGLTQAGFDSVDAVIPVPNAKVDGEAYFFKGSQYARIQVVRSGADKLTWGPYPIADYWKTFDWI
ncbi:Hemopexin [Aspergillus tamarii]|uniref:Hemopexin n=1 Tax=Aspergillus tamarii TaxID=41984 RepID=A0A5N6V9P1_ASPTM|nr:Hemopexin [Aspergillus tamarii]